MSLPISITIGRASERPTLWMHREDRDVFGAVRGCAPCPAVMVLKDDPHVKLDRQWQYYLRAINHNMTLENVFLLLDNRLAFANNTGFTSLSNPAKKDYFFDRTSYTALPGLDKVRTCARSVLTGAPAYSLWVGIQQAVTAVTDRLRGARTFLAGRSIRALLTSTNVLQVQTFDSRQPPPLKPGRRYPSRIEEANLDDYLYNPREHPWMFLVANIVNRAGEVVQFPRGATYPWFLDGATPASFLPHISNPTYGPVQVPLTRLLPVTAIPSPYRYSR